MFPGCRRPTSNKRDSGTLQVAAQRYGSMKYRKKEVTVAGRWIGARSSLLEWRYPTVFERRAELTDSKKVAKQRWREERRI